MERLELSREISLEPKSSASTNSATPALNTDLGIIPIVHLSHFKFRRKTIFLQSIYYYIIIYISNIKLKKKYIDHIDLCIFFKT